MINKLMFLPLALCHSVYAGVCVQNSNTVHFTGLDSSNGVVYAGLKDHDGNCSCSHVRFSPSRTKTDMALSILMSAKLSKTKVRIDLQEPGNCDSAYRVYLQ